MKVVLEFKASCKPTQDVPEVISIVAEDQKKNQRFVDIDLTDYQIAKIRNMLKDLELDTSN